MNTNQNQSKLDHKNNTFGVKQNISGFGAHYSYGTAFNPKVPYNFESATGITYTIFKAEGCLPPCYRDKVW